jgi:hypothetical protein
MGFGGDVKEKIHLKLNSAKKETSLFQDPVFQR